MPKSDLGMGFSKKDRWLYEYIQLKCRIERTRMNGNYPGKKE